MELNAIRKAREVCDYIFLITHKSPKEFRFTLIARMHDYSLSAIENMLRANAIKVTSEELLKERKAYQASAMTELTLLGYMVDFASGQKCILARQHEHITKLLYDCRLMLGSWTRSDAARFEQSRKAKAQNASSEQPAINPPASEADAPKPQEPASYPSRKSYKPKYVEPYEKKNSEAQNSDPHFEQLAIWDGEWGAGERRK